MTHSGAQVIHPKTMKPLHNKGIPLYVKSFVSPEIPGTVIHSIDHKIDLPPIFIFKESTSALTKSVSEIMYRQFAGNPASVICADDIMAL